MAIDRLLESSIPLTGAKGEVLFKTERLIVRRYNGVADGPGLATAANHPEIGFNLRDGFPSPYTLAEAEGFLSKSRPNDHIYYPNQAGVFLKPDEDAGDYVQIGDLGLTPGADVHYRSWAIGYWFTPTAWGKGYATEMLRGFARFCFETWPTLWRLEADVFDHNPSNMRVLEKCGFVREGVRRDAAEKGAILRDIHMYGLIRTDLGL